MKKLFCFITIIFVSIFSSNIKDTKFASTICIDAGHGGFDGGATRDNILEKDITLKASLYIGRFFENTGYKVIYTRTKDKALHSDKTTDMKKRLNIINKKTNILYLSIHANVYGAESIHGAQVFYNEKNSSSKTLAELIQNNLLIFDKTNTRLAKAIKDKYITDNALIPGAIVELGFISNKQDKEYLCDDNKLAEECMMIYLAVLEYINLDKN